ncbi:MAG: hypothetical protein EOO24_29130 [Comamonadaceae bacterium]|nr:MAG: hypothetical protein EOO24_29130 [Comamonadaceae bacterium]
MPGRFARVGDLHAAIDAAPQSLEPLLALSASQQAAGQGDAPWPPHDRKGAAEPKRAPPSAVAGRRVPTKPLLEIGRAEREPDAVALADAWKQAHPAVARHLQPADVLVDRMRGRSSLWYRVRVNLEHVPPAERPAPVDNGRP